MGAAPSPPHPTSSMSAAGQDGTTTDPALCISAAGPRDSRRLASLAWLAQRSRPRADTVLLAEHDGVPVAAIALTTGSVRSDPSRPTQDAERALNLTRYRILHQGGHGAAARALLRRATR